MDAVVTEVLSEPDGIFALKDEQRTALKAFLRGEDIFFMPDWLREEFS